MRHILLTLALVSLAPPLDAQEKVALTEVINAPKPIDYVRAAYEDGSYASIPADSANKYWSVAYLLPGGKAPDSMTFIVAANCEFEMMSGWAENNMTVLGRGRNMTGAITVAYKTYETDYCVAIGVPMHDINRKRQHGSAAVDAAYAWYHDTAKASVGERFSESYSRAYAKSHACKWYDVTGRVMFVGTSGELELERPNCVLFGPYQMIWSGNRLSWKDGEIDVMGDGNVR